LVDDRGGIVLIHLGFFPSWENFPLTEAHIRRAWGEENPEGLSSAHIFGIFLYNFVMNTEIRTNFSFGRGAGLPRDMDAGAGN
jgi:hypothetical protein